MDISYGGSILSPRYGDVYKGTLSPILNYEGFDLDLLENEMINQSRAYRTVCEYRPCLSPIGSVAYFLDLLEERQSQMQAETCDSRFRVKTRPASAAGVQPAMRDIHEFKWIIGR